MRLQTTVYQCYLQTALLPVSSSVHLETRVSRALSLYSEQSRGFDRGSDPEPSAERERGSNEQESAVDDPKAHMLNRQHTYHIRDRHISQKPHNTHTNTLTSPETGHSESSVARQ
jgi:hypothetical protein